MVKSELTVFKNAFAIGPFGKGTRSDKFRGL